jgi:hypothetical protein
MRHLAVAQSVSEFCSPSPFLLTLRNDTVVEMVPMMVMFTKRVHPASAYISVTCYAVLCRSV